MMGLASLLASSSLPTRSRVASLPGYGKPPTAHWTGFVEVNAATQTTFFFYLVESARNPSTDPLVWWFNGGPGASSFAGLFSENGPLLLNASGQLTANPFAWNEQANVLYVEFGPGIGYSFCANSSRADAPCPQSSGDCSPCHTSDDLLAEQNAVLLATLLGDRRYFPELAGRDVYLAGESYAGVYVPLLARQLIRRSDAGAPFSLRGLWVTDPLDLGVAFAWQKGLIDGPTRAALTGPACVAGRTKVGDRVRRTDTAECRGAWRLYDLATAGIGDAVHPTPVAGLPMYIDPLSALGPSGGPDLEAWLNRRDVRAALHATGSPNGRYHLELNNNGYPQYQEQYAACNDDALSGAPSMLDVYREIVASASRDRREEVAALEARGGGGEEKREVEADGAAGAGEGAGAAARRATENSGGGLRHVIISSGDIDPVVDMHGTEAAVGKLGFALAAGGARRPWFYNASGVPVAALAATPTAWGTALHAHGAGAQVGGFVTSYAAAAGVDVSFVAIRDSGHMVPAYAPHKAAHILRRLLAPSVGEKARVGGPPGLGLAPPLPAGWANESDAVFYGEGKAGLFATWVNGAMAAPYVL